MSASNATDECIYSWKHTWVCKKEFILSQFSSQNIWYPLPVIWSLHDGRTINLSVKGEAARGMVRTRWSLWNFFVILVVTSNKWHSFPIMDLSLLKFFVSILPKGHWFPNSWVFWIERLEIGFGLICNDTFEKIWQLQSEEWNRLERIRHSALRVLKCLRPRVRAQNLTISRYVQSCSEN